MKTLLVVMLAITVLAVACNDGSGDSRPTQSPATITPTSAPPATVPAATDVGESVVFVRDDDLWVAPLDSSGEPRAITSGSFRASFAGYVLRDDSGIDLYYISQLEENPTFDTPVEFGVYRVAVDGGEPEALFRFTSSVPHLAGAAVSPDGGSMVYADAHALILHDLGSGDETVLGRSSYVLAGDGSYILTGQLTAPRWSPSGDMLHVSKFEGQDTIVSIIIDLPPRPVRLVDIDYPGHRGVWSPDGSRLCLFSGDIYDGGLTIYDVETHEQIDVLAMGVLPPKVGNGPSRVGGCAWSGDGRLAVSYTPEDMGPQTAYVLDAQLALLSESEPIEPFGGVIDWLSDGSGVVVSGRNPDGETFTSGIYRPGEAIEWLPNETGREQAVVP